MQAGHGLFSWSRSQSWEESMKTYGRWREISAPPERVWDIWSDPTKWNQWNPSVKNMDLDAPFAAGTTGRMVTPSGRTHNVTFHNIQPGKSYELETKVIPGTRFTFHCEITPSATGSTVSQTVRITGPMAFLVGPIAGSGIAKSFEKVLAGLDAKAQV
jgi:uncharacterized protein YndB with AHSA1/START domain